MTGDSVGAVVEAEDEELETFGVWFVLAGMLVAVMLLATTASWIVGFDVPDGIMIAAGGLFAALVIMGVVSWLISWRRGDIPPIYGETASGLVLAPLGASFVMGWVIRLIVWVGVPPPPPEWVLALFCPLLAPFLIGVVAWPFAYFGDRRFMRRQRSNARS